MYLIIGANGFVGSYAIKNILEKTTDDIVATDMNISEGIQNERITWKICDITLHKDILSLNEYCKNMKNLKIIYLAAYHLPDKVLANPRLAWNINITSLSDFLNTMENVGCLFYSSTEMVYEPGDLEKLFKEDAPKKPLNAYGKHKVVAESMVNGYGYNVVRFPFMIGPSILSYKKHFYDCIVDTIMSGGEMQMFKDAFKTPLDFNTAIGTVIDLVENYSAEMPKILNISGDEIMSKYEIGLRIAKHCGADDKLIVPISVNDDNKIFTEKRADCSLLDNTLVKQVLGYTELKMKF